MIRSCRGSRGKALILLIAVALLFGSFPAGSQKANAVGDEPQLTVETDYSTYQIGEMVKITATYFYGVPLSGVDINLEIAAPDGKKIPFQETTDDQGQVQVTLQLVDTAYMTIIPGTYQVTANAQGVTSPQGTSFAVAEAATQAQLSVETNQSAYEKGNTVIITATYTYGYPLPGMDINLEVSTPDGKIIPFQETTDDQGQVQVLLPLVDTGLVTYGPGTYQVSATAQGIDPPETTSFDVTIPAVPPQLTVVAAQGPYQMGDTVNITATYSTDVPQAGVQVNLVITTPDNETINYGGLTNIQGELTYSLELVSTADVTIVPGTYQVSASADGIVAPSTTSFEVAAPVVGEQSTTPDSNQITVQMNIPGSADTVTGNAGAVTGNAEVRIYTDNALTQLVGNVVANADGSFTPIAIGDNLYGTVYLTATEAAKTESLAIELTNDIEAPTIYAYEVNPDINIGVGRPAMITATTNESVGWRVEVRKPPTYSLAGKPYTVDGGSLEYSWEPANTSQPSGEYKVVIIATDAVGNKETVEVYFQVYNYPIIVSDPQVLKADGTVADPPSFLPGMFYQVEATFTNLGPGSITPLAVVQTVEKVGTSTNLVSLGSVKIPIPEGESVTLAVGAMAPNKPGTYYAQVFAWNDWPAKAGGAFQNLAPMGEVIITVSQ